MHVCIGNEDFPGDSVSYVSDERCSCLAETIVRQKETDEKQEEQSQQEYGEQLVEEAIPCNQIAQLEELTHVQYGEQLQEEAIPITSLEEQQ